MKIVFESNFDVRRTGYRAACLAFSLLAWVGGRCAAAEDAAKDLAAYWTFDEGKGAKVFDYSGHGNHGAMRGDAKWTDGKFGKALYFNGKDSLVEVPDGPWNQAAPLTFTVWFKRQGGGQIIEHMLGGAVGGAFAFNGNRFGFYDKETTDTSVNADSKEDEWTFAAITISDSEAKIYQDGALKQTVPIKGFPRIAGPLHMGARGTVGDQYFKGWIDDVALYHKALSADEIRALYENYQKGQPPTPYDGLQVVNVNVPKLFYHPGEKATATIGIKNYTNQELGGVLAVKLTSALADERALPNVTVNLKPLEVLVVDVPVEFATARYGCQLRANVGYAKDGGAKTWGTGATADFAVADNFWDVALGGLVPSANAGHESAVEQARRLGQLRSNYCNWFEMFFWAPDDWGLMAPQAGRYWWYSGQEGYFVQRANLKTLINLAHASGMKAITYGKNASAGPDGWELARRHPDWFLHDNLDRIAGNASTRDLDDWNNRELRESGRFAPASTWQYLMPDLRRQAPLDWGIEQIALSAKEFGWDGVRFDGHFTVSDDELSAYNMRRLKERLWKDDPNFLFGFNYAFSPELYDGINHEMREGLAGGGMWMQEAIKSMTYTNSKRYTSWKLYATNELDVAKQIQAAGGTYHCIYNLSPDAQGLYTLIYGLIAGGHPVYSSHDTVPGSANWGRFMTRWSRFLWNRNIKPMPKPQDRIQVAAPAAVFWQPLTQELVDSAGRKFWMVHVVNPASTDVVRETGAAQLPQPQDNVTLTLKAPAGERIERVVLADPANAVNGQVLPLVQAGESQKVVIPQLKYWAMVVVELSGKYKPNAPLSRFADAPDSKRVALARKAATSSFATTTIDPLHPTSKIALRPNEKIWETDAGFWNLNADAVNDPDASEGKAQRGQINGNYLGRTVLGPFVPGHYKFTLRMKWAGPNAERLLGRVGVTASDEKTFYIKHDVSLNDNDATGHVANQYQDHVFEIDIKEDDVAHCFVGVNNLEAPGDSIYLDYIKTELVQAYTDQQLAQWTKPIPRPENLPELQGSKPRKVLQVKGQYWQFYGVGKAVKCDSTYDIPKTYEALYAYDAVVMNNVDFADRYPVRKLYEDYVEDGGRLILLGGNQEFRLNWKNTYLEKLLPVALGGGTLLPCQPPLVLGNAENGPYAGAPSLFWRHDVAPKPGAEVLAYGGSKPIVLRSKVGKGKVVVFTGTVNGVETAASPAFWDDPAWGNLVKKMVWN